MQTKLYNSWIISRLIVNQSQNKFQKKILRVARVEIYTKESPSMRLVKIVTKREQKEEYS